MLPANACAGLAAVSASGAMPTKQTSGSAAAIGSSDTIDVPYPASINANDILYLQIAARETSDGTGITTPSGWTPVNHVTDTTGDHAFGLYWKRAAGTESGNLTVTAAYAGVTGRLLAARMYRFSGCTTSGTPHEAAASGYVASSSTLAQRSITTTGPNRLCCHFNTLQLNTQSLSSFTGESNGDFTEADESNSTTTLQLQTAPMANAGTISGGSIALSPNAAKATFVLALLPT